ncbi:unnamed protein product [Prorocentrum cordatum]|uniref:Secreted protein n=1 Tax=Prorocentrum cordatum TaxID=2364126 RepID=A0ABN9V8K1_9DINO|nr:unnamed protein product [Polarella glacialis]
MHVYSRFLLGFVVLFGTPDGARVFYLFKRGCSRGAAQLGAPCQKGIGQPSAWHCIAHPFRCTVRAVCFRPNILFDFQRTLQRRDEETGRQRSIANSIKILCGSYSSPRDPRGRATLAK